MTDDRRPTPPELPAQLHGCIRAMGPLTAVDLEAIEDFRLYLQRTPKERVEWNPRDQVWLPGIVLKTKHEHGQEWLRVQLDEGDCTWVQRRHTRTINPARAEDTP